MNRFVKLASVAALAVSLAACASDPDTMSTAAAAAGSALNPDSIEYFNVEIGDRVQFALDSARLDQIAIGTLSGQAQWLQSHPAISVTIEGHADERGTREYNLGLGARRAQTVRDFLAAQGVDPSRMRVVSFGKERPVAVCANESCWSQNRRAVTVAAGGLTS